MKMLPTMDRKLLHTHMITRKVTLFITSCFCFVCVCVFRGRFFLCSLFFVLKQSKKTTKKKRRNNESVLCFRNGRASVASGLCCGGVVVRYDSLLDAVLRDANL